MVTLSDNPLVTLLIALILYICIYVYIYIYIGHDEKVTDITYENSQARERTQVATP